jgi:hypothetical protein
VNANLVFKWRRLCRSSAEVTGFVRISVSDIETVDYGTFGYPRSNFLTICTHFEPRSNPDRT